MFPVSDGGKIEILVMEYFAIDCLTGADSATVNARFVSVDIIGFDRDCDFASIAYIGCVFDFLFRIRNLDFILFIN